MGEISTAQAARGDEVGYWQHSVKSALGLDARITRDPQEPYWQRMLLDRFDSVGVAQRSGSAFRVVSRSERVDAPAVMALVMLEGRCRYRQAGRPEVELAAGEFCVHPTADFSVSRFEGGHRHVLLSIPRHAIDGECAGWEREQGRVLGPGAHAPAAMFVGLVRALPASPQGLNADCRRQTGRLMLGLLAASMAASAEGASSQSSRMVAFHRQRIERHLAAHLQDADLSLASIAADLGLSVRYLHRLYSGEPASLMASVWQRRLEAAQRLLTRRDGVRRSVSEVAYSLGFKDLSHFSRAFARRYGCSPREVQRERAAPMAG